MKLTSEYFESANITAWQPERGHRYGHESMALAEFAKISPGQRVAELGSGIGLISLLLAARRQPSEVVAVEIQPAFHKIAARNVKENGYDSVVRCVNEDYRKFAGANKGAFDCVVSNPPFYRAGEGRLSPDPSRAAARHELNGTIDELVQSAHALLLPGGFFFVVFDARRDEELKSAAKSAGFKGIKVEDTPGPAFILAALNR
ncbi:MAG: methyltransferase [bacterium]